MKVSLISICCILSWSVHNKWFSMSTENGNFLFILSHCWNMASNLLWMNSVILADGISCSTFSPSLQSPAGKIISDISHHPVLQQLLLIQYYWWLIMTNWTNRFHQLSNLSSNDVFFLSLILFGYSILVLGFIYCVSRY